MSEEMKRLLESDLSSLERSILESASDDQPSTEGMKRSAEALGLSGAIGAAKIATAAKWGAALGVTALIGVGVFSYAVSQGAGSNDGPSKDLRTSVPMSAGSEVKPEAVAPSDVTSTKDENLEEREVPKAPSRALVRPAPTSISEEIAAIDRARKALSAGRYAETLQEVASYRQRFSKPAFAEEAMLLRIDALFKSGAKEQGKSEAAVFLKRYPKSLHVPRIERLAQ